MKINPGYREIEIDERSLIDISIPLLFNGPQPNAYGVDAATSEACAAGDIVGDTRRGGSCNFEQYTFIPHCNGTHTECIGHITDERIAVVDCLRDVFVPAVLVSVEPARANESSDTYTSGSGDGDLLIERSSFETLVGQQTTMAGETPAVRQGKALIVRTLPNDDTKLTRQYGDVVPPYFSSECMEYIVESGFRHLLVDLPSIDRTFDEGRLSNHRTFWNIEPGSRETHTDSRIYNTITELIYVPGQVEDGEYLLNLQIAPFKADASPSRPILFRLI